MFYPGRFDLILIGNSTSSVTLDVAVTRTLIDDSKLECILSLHLEPNVSIVPALNSSLTYVSLHYVPVSTTPCCLIAISPSRSFVA